MIDEPDDLTRGVAHAVLRARTPKSGAFGRRSSRSAPAQTGASFRLHLDGDRAAAVPPTLVAEDRGRRPGRSGARRAGYRNEIGFYTVFRDRVQIRTPRCWHAEISDDSCSFVLLLDDLAPARPGVQADGCTVDQAADAVRNLAGSARAGLERRRRCRTTASGSAR